MYMPLNITGQTAPSRSKPLTNQLSQNLYSEIVDDPFAKSRYVLHGFPGMLLFGSSSAGADRGMLLHNDVVYKVTGDKLYQVGPDGTHTELGTIPGTEQCILTGIGANIVVANGAGKVYQYNGSTVSEITDPDLETPNSVAHLNNQIIYDGDGGRFVTSDVGDATTIQGLNYATAESNADDLIRAYVFSQLLYLLGNDTIEVWWNSGSGNPPFERLQGGVMEVGLGALNSVSNNREYMYFLGDDRHVHRVNGTTSVPITSIGIHNEINEMTQITDAIGFCFTFQGQNFYCIIFPAANKSFLFSETTGWHTLSSGNSGGRTFANSHVYAYGKNLVGDYRGGNLYEWDVDTYTDNGETIIRIRDTAPLHGGHFKKPGRPITINSVELIMETGVGLVSGQGSDPVIMMSISDDGGRTFGTEDWSKFGESGEYNHRVFWGPQGQFYNPIFRFKISDPVPVSIYSAGMDIEVGI